MRVLVALTYYRPHVSGLTMYAQRLAEGLAARGHEVTVLTSRYDRRLPPEERRGGVRVVRVPVALRVGKGVLMPRYRGILRRLAPDHDALVVNYPITPFEAAALLAAARRARRPVLVVYQCDLALPPSPARRRVEALMARTGRRLVEAARRVVVLSDDYAQASALLRPYRAKCLEGAPPISVQRPTPGDARAFRARHAPGADLVIGVASRVAAEKGLEYLLAARERLERGLGRVHLLLTGDAREALGEKDYWRVLAPLCAAWGDRLSFVGRLSDREMACFFAACDVTALPSVNSTESFGLVQVESMLCGTPVVASDLPGIRVPVQRSGMGRLVPPRDTTALAEALIEVVRGRAILARRVEDLRALFRLDHFVDEWETLLREAVPAPPHPAPAGDALAGLMRVHVEEVPAFRALVRAVEADLVAREARGRGRILDLGCGDGLFGSLALATPAAYGVDPDPRAAERARRTGSYERVLAEQADRMSLAEGACDLVLANSVLEHIPDRDAVLAETRRVLATGGRLLITAPSHRFADGLGLSVLLDRAGLRGLATRYRAWFNRLSLHHHLDSAASWKTCLEARGFRVVRHQYYLSRAAMRWFDVLHFVCAPCLLARRFLGRWHPWGRPLAAGAWTWWLLGLARQPPDAEGPYVFIVAEKI